MKQFESIYTPNSSAIAKVSYDPTFCHLFIQFKSGKIYRYMAVPESIFNGFKETLENGESTGRYSSQNVRGKFEYVCL